MKKMRTIGSAKRINVELGMGAKYRAWDCRPFGFGRVVTPILPVQIELEPGTHLDLHTGELLAERSSVAA
jgi:hypothetical protein